LRHSEVVRGGGYTDIHHGDNISLLQESRLKILFFVPLVIGNSIFLKRVISVFVFSEGTGNLIGLRRIITTAVFPQTQNFPLANCNSADRGMFSDTLWLAKCCYNMKPFTEWQLLERRAIVICLISSK
jgi:hypothetical protein